MKENKESENKGNREAWREESAPSSLSSGESEDGRPPSSSPVAVAHSVPVGCLQPIIAFVGDHRRSAEQTFRVGGGGLQ